MAGSLNHIVNEDGGFRMDGIENIGDAHEALDECFKIIHFLSDGNKDKINQACEHFKLPRLDTDLALGSNDEL